MKLRIKNFRGIQAAEIETASTITVVGADNGDGKSSLAQAIGAVLSGTTIPFEGVAKSDVATILHGDAKTGSVDLIDGENGATIKWPECEYSTIKSPPTVNPIAAGLQSFVSMKPHDRLNYMINLMDATPSKSDLIEAVKTAEFPYSDGVRWFENCWATIEAQGWDAAEKYYRQEGTKRKGGWEEITGEHYGTRKADGWLPATWAADLADATEEQLTGIVSKETEYVEGAIRASAISDEKRAELQNRAVELPGLQDAAKAMDTKIKELAKEIESLESDRAALRIAASALICPKCNAKLHLKGDTLVVVDTDAASNTGETLQRLDLHLKEQRATQADLTSKRVDIQQRIDLATNAEQTLASAGEASDSNEADLADARKRLEKATERLQAFRARAQAERLANKIDAARKLCDILSSKGLRQTMFAAALAQLNSALLDLSTVAKWGAVALREDGTLTYGGIPYALLAESEQYRVDVVLQMAVASIERSPFIVIDRADTLLRNTRKGLYRALVRIRIPALVFVAAEKPDDLMSMAAVHGARYWVDKGSLCRIES